MVVGKITDRLWAKITRGADAVCWPWTAYRDRDGYGRLRVGKTNRPAHALVLECDTGELAAGRVAMHMCDHPWCCNPRHLRWGTHAENHADRNWKFRQAAGEKNGQSKLSWRAVDAIRAQHKPHSSTRGTFALARAYSVNKNTIDRIVNDHGWEK